MTESQQGTLDGVADRREMCRIAGWTRCGDTKVITLPADGQQIVNLLQAVKERILSRLPKGDSNG